MNKLIANLIRSFHAIFWLALFVGVLTSARPRIYVMCTFVILVAIILWGVLGYCFVNILENGFDPIPHSVDSDTSLVFITISEKTGIKPEAFTLAFNYFIYFVLLVGLLRIYCFINPMKI